MPQLRGLHPHQRFWHWVDKTETCWLWQGYLTADGYGQFSTPSPDGLRRHKYRAHRYAYTISKGPIPKNRVIDHLCRVRACVNPSHLRAVTSQENSPWALRTHCSKGHIFDLFNTYYRKDSGRRCRVCIREKPA